MPAIAAQTTPLNPYKNFKFLVSWDTRPVAAVSKVSGLKRTTQVVAHRAGSDFSTSRKSPGRSEFDPITLERGVTLDAAFETWANAVWAYRNPPGTESYLANFRKNITLELLNDAGQTVLRYLIYNCWVSEYQALPELDANANAVAIQMIKLENEGWQREVFTPAAEPSYG